MFISGMFTIPSHGLFMALFYPQYCISISLYRAKYIIIVCISIYVVIGWHYFGNEYTYIYIYNYNIRFPLLIYPLLMNTIAICNYLYRYNSL